MSVYRSIEFYDDNRFDWAACRFRLQALSGVPFFVSVNKLRWGESRACLQGYVCCGLPGHSLEMVFQFKEWLTHPAAIDCREALVNILRSTEVYVKAIEPLAKLAAEELSVEFVTIDEARQEALAALVKAKAR